MLEKRIPVYIRIELNFLSYVLAVDSSILAWFVRADQPVVVKAADIPRHFLASTRCFGHLRIKGTQNV